MKLRNERRGISKGPTNRGTFIGTEQSFKGALKVIPIMAERQVKRRNGLHELRGEKTPWRAS
jgi:hypothetical protein